MKTCFTLIGSSSLPVCPQQHVDLFCEAPKLSNIPLGRSERVIRLLASALRRKIILSDVDELTPRLTQIRLQSKLYNYIYVQITTRLCLNGTGKTASYCQPGRESCACTRNGAYLHPRGSNKCRTKRRAQEKTARHTRPESQAALNPLVTPV
jgi:hypothetical protein